ncbi:hypothetical protein [Metallosphaera cuprina]|uniref:Uncharacterized protein n=1 Tax=Metallosphaera cuprina (strain Ar-4) TaxID=1006006 RepID=F4FY49_METCR|nr:hypothetical protein [Metallosphaera cuprina]AEB95422.1 conserved hypothetical protein [Metallosphaera cuprina Ar-4]
MTWNFKSSKVEVKDAPLCVVDEIERQLEPLFKKAGMRTGHGSEAHRLVSEVVIKVLQERKETIDDVKRKWNLKEVDEIIREIEAEARRRGLGS